MKWNEAYDIYNWLLKFRVEQYEGMFAPNEVWYTFLHLFYRVGVWVDKADRD